MSTAGPRTSMPLAMSAARSAVTKNAVGLSTDTDSVVGDPPAATAPRSSSRMLPGSRYAAIDGSAPAAVVTTELTMVSPLPAGAMLTPAESPADGPGVTVTLTAFSLYWSAPTPAASSPGKSSHDQPKPSVSSSNPLSSPITRPLMTRMPRCFNRAAQSANTASAMPSAATRLGSPLPTTTRSPSRVPPL